ncbi:hypothetical protein tb265_23470 [Gemmatimonadetes bacterium T265]|nr:hypothetical protein tb265_23470 [Gemmatimonadetes bacterium T265]
MIALAMIYAALVGVLCAAGAWLAERAAHAAGRAARWGWASALAIALALPAAALWQATHDATARGGDGGVAAERINPASLSGGRTRMRVAEPPRWWCVLRALPRHVAAPAEWGSLDGGLLAVWLVLTAGALARIAAATAATRRTSYTWPARAVSGERVRVSDEFGPAVVGAWRAEIVLPRWALDDPRLPLMLAHECEHVRAHDARLLAAGAVVAALVPWNPAVWWLVRRLRAAVEVDCDRRVLARCGACGAGDAVTRRYGALLLDVAARPHVRAPALTLGGTPTLLRRRIEAMSSERSRAPRRALVPALAAVAAVAAACEIPKPTGPAPANRVPLTSITAADPSAAPAAGPNASIDAVRSVIAARMPELLAARTNRTQIVWVVQRADGTIERVTHADAAGPQRSALRDPGAPFGVDRDPLAAVDPQQLASVEVLRIAPGRVAQDSVHVVWVRRRAAGDTTKSGGGTPRATATLATVRGRVVGTRVPGDSVLVVVDGRIAGRGHAVLDTFSPDTIATVDVFKGALATERYGDAGRAGVIVLNTKKPAVR